MSQRTQERKIGEHAYAVTQLPARRGFKTFNRLGRVLGPALGPLAESLKGGGLTDMDMSALGSAFGALFANLSDADADSLQDDLFYAATVDGKPLLPQIDTLFMGRVDQLLAVLWFAIEVNFGSFFDVARSLAGAGAKKEPSAPSPQVT